jgi:hypothetical protein
MVFHMFCCPAVKKVQIKCSKTEAKIENNGKVL